ncbi:MAG: NF038122 family metalloprotease [Caulobacteraceae bacterium]
MQINLVFDPSAASAPAGFEAAAQDAAEFYDQLFTNPITVTIDVGWGEVNGQRITDPQNLAESVTNGDIFSYSEVRSALLNSAASPVQMAADATLPASDPTGGGAFFVAQAEELALGLGFPSGVAGAVGLNASLPFTFDPNNRSAPGEFDAIGALEHEMSEVLGRISDLGMDTQGAASLYNPLDLFRYSAPGIRDLVPAAGWFSINGENLLMPYNDPNNGGDAGDWTGSVVGDSYGDGARGIAGLVSNVDIAEMNVLGYQVASQFAQAIAGFGGSTAPTPTPIPTPTPTPPPALATPPSPPSPPSPAAPPPVVLTPAIPGRRFPFFGGPDGPDIPDGPLTPMSPPAPPSPTSPIPTTPTPTPVVVAPPSPPAPPAPTPSPTPVVFTPPSPPTPTPLVPAGPGMPYTPPVIGPAPGPLIAPAPIMGRPTSPNFTPFV